MALPVVVSRIQNRRGTQTQFNSLYPPGYNGTGGVDINVWPDILMPGELALCTDTRRIFIGNLNGEYLELSVTFTDGLFLTPLQLVLPPSPTYTVIPELTFSPTPFFNILYDVNDSLNPDWNSVASTSFSRNGELKITAVADFPDVPNLPFPPITSVGLSDVSTEVKNPSTYTLEDISFKAEYNGATIEISYTHDFPTSLTFSSSTIRWLPF